MNNVSKSVKHGSNVLFLGVLSNPIVTGSTRDCTYYSATPADALLQDSEDKRLIPEDYFVLNPDHSSLDGFRCIDGENLEHLIEVKDVCTHSETLELLKTIAEDHIDS